MSPTTSTPSRGTFYDLLAVAPGASVDELRTAYRNLARALHPDVSGLADGGAQMAELNDAWRVLSDPLARAEYDRTLRTQRPSPRFTPPASPGAHAKQPRTGWGEPGREHANAGSADAKPSQPPPGAARGRRQAWIAGVQAQIRRLSLLAGRSATQTLLLKSPLADRAGYEAVVDRIVSELSVETEPRVRAARAAGAAPLDLGVAATLIGIRTMADALRRQSSLGVTTELMMTAELIDRMWDVLAHELPTTLEAALGGNPHVSRLLLR